MLLFQTESRGLGNLVITPQGSVPDGQFQCLITNLVPGPEVVIEVSTNLIHWTKISTKPTCDTVLSFEDADRMRGGQRFYRCYQVIPPADLRMIETAMTNDPGVPSVIVSAPCNALRIWTGDQPAREPWLDIYARIGAGAVQTLRMYRWQARILYTGTNAVALGTLDGRPLTVAPMYVPETTERPGDVTNWAYCDKAGLPLWQPAAPHVILPTNSSCFSIVATNEQTVFISQFDGTRWSPVQFLILESNTTTTVRCNYRWIALANYDGKPLQVIGPSKSEVGGTGRSMSLSWSITGMQHHVTNTAGFMTAMSNAVSGDEIVLADGIYAIETNLDHYCFSANESAGNAGAEGITFRSESGNRTNCVFVGATTNTGGWSFYPHPLQFTHEWRKPATFVGLSWDFTGGSNNFMRIWGGWWQFQNCRFFGAGPVDPDGEGNVYFFNRQKDGITNVVDFLHCQFDGSAGRQLAFSGKQAAGSTNAGTRIRVINCDNLNTTGGTKGDLLAAFYNVFPEIYGGSLVNAAANAINGGYGANVFCFFTRFDGGGGGASLMLGSLFGCQWTSGRSEIRGVNSYHLFGRYALTNSMTTEGLFTRPPTLVGHNLLSSWNDRGSALYSTSCDGNFSGNVCQGFCHAIRISYTTDTNSLPLVLFNNSFVSNTTGVYNILTNYACVLTNNAFAMNTASVSFSAEADAIKSADYNTLDSTVTGYTPSASDIVADADLDSRLFPSAGGNVDANGTDLGWIGDSDPFGFVLVYKVGVWPRGARSRPVVVSGAQLYPDLW